MPSLTQQLKNISVQPDRAWKQNTRDFLLSEISTPLVEKVNFTKESQFMFPRFAWKPVGIFILVAAFLFGGSGLAITTAKNAMPGDGLYPLKIAIEKTQLTVAKDHYRKVKLTTAFTGNRVEELRSIMDSAQDKQKIDLAYNAVKSQIQDVQSQFNDLKQNNNREIINTALDLNKKISYYKQKLGQARTKEVEKVSDEINQVLDEVRQDVLAVLVEKHTAGELLDNGEEIGISLQERIAEIEEKAEALPEETIVVHEKLVAAKAALDKKDYNLVFALTSDTNQILMKILYGEIDKVIKTNEAEETIIEIEGVADIKDTIIQEDPIIEIGEEVAPTIIPEPEIKEFEVGISK